MDLVVKLVRSCLRFNKLEYARRDLFSKRVEVNAPILEVQVGHHELKDKLFAQLTINGDPVCAGLLDDFSLLEFLDHKATLVRICQYKFTLEPL